MPFNDSITPVAFVGLVGTTMLMGGHAIDNQRNTLRATNLDSPFAARVSPRRYLRIVKPHINYTIEITYGRHFQTLQWLSLLIRLALSIAPSAGRVRRLLSRVSSGLLNHPSCL